MNMPRHAPPKMPAKFHLLPMMDLPKGKRNFALTAKTYGKAQGSSVRYVRRGKEENSH